MRVFAAIDVPSKVKDYLYKFQSKLNTPLAKVSWTAKKHIHITLKFFGEFDEKEVEELKRRLEKIKFRSFEVVLDSKGVFPRKDFIRIVWIGLKPENDLVQLQQEIDSITLDFGFTRQEFRSHMTLGRVKWVKNKEQYLNFLKDFEPEKLKFKVNSFYLYKSYLTKDGPKYTRLGEYFLKR